MYYHDKFDDTKTKPKKYEIFYAHCYLMIKKDIPTDILKLIFNRVEVLENDMFKSSFQ